MNEIVIQLLIAGGVMGVIDAVWLSVVAKPFYQKEIGALLLKKPNLPAAIIFYIIFVVALVVLVINPAVDNGSWMEALSFGALFGLATYATYDLTNLATIKGFTKKLVLVDLTWGTLLTATTSVATYFLVQAL